MGEEDGLAALEVGVTGNDGVRAAFAGFDEGALEVSDIGGEAVDGVFAVEADIGGDLVIATAGGVEFGAGGSDAGGEVGLDVHVDVLEGGLELEVAVFDFVLDLEKAFFDGGAFAGGEDAGFFEAFGVGDGAADVLGVEAPVKGDGFAEGLDELAGGLREAAFPHDERGVTK